MTTTRPSMPPALRRLIGAQALMNAAHFIALPFLVLHLAAQPGVGQAGAGLVLGLYLGLARLAPLVTGPVADLAGLWPSLRAGLALRAVGLAILALAGTLEGAAVAAIVLGLGVAIHEPVVNGILASQARAVRETALMRNIQALNVGCILGPAAGIALSASLPLAFAVAAGLTAALAVWACLECPPPDARGRRLDVPAVGSALRDGRYLGFALALVPFWALYAQLFGALPLLLSAAGGSAAWASAVILINGTVGAATVPLLVSISHRIGPRTLLAGGSALAAVATAALAFADGLAALLVIVILFSVAETATTAGADILTARHADGDAVASRFAMLGAGSGIGASAGAPRGLAATGAGGPGFVALGLVGLLSVGAAALLPRHGDGTG
jgi:predicted MFS family arabinose efflux permease